MSGVPKTGAVIGDDAIVTVIRKFLLVPRRSFPMKKPLSIQPRRTSGSAQPATFRGRFFRPQRRGMITNVPVYIPGNPRLPAVFIKQAATGRPHDHLAPQAYRHIYKRLEIVKVHMTERFFAVRRFSISARSPGSRKPVRELASRMRSSEFERRATPSSGSSRSRHGS